MSLKLNEEKSLTTTLIQNLVKVVVPKMVESIISKVAFLGFGPIPTILSMLLSKFMEFALHEMGIAANSLSIKIDIEIDVKKMEEALTAHEKNLTDKGEVDAANDKIKDAMRDLITIGRGRI